MTALRERMLMDMRIRSFSPHTKKCYVRHVQLFAEHFNTPPDRLGPDRETIATRDRSLIMKQIKVRED